MFDACVCVCRERFLVSGKLFSACLQIVLSLIIPPTHNSQKSCVAGRCLIIVTIASMCFECGISSHWYFYLIIFLGWYKLRCGGMMHWNVMTLVLNNFERNEDPLHQSSNAQDPYATMHHFVTEMCKLLLQNGALWDICRIHCEIYMMGLLYG